MQQSTVAFMPDSPSIKQVLSKKILSKICLFIKYLTMVHLLVNRLRTFIKSQTGVHQPCLKILKTIVNRVDVLVD